MANHFASQFAKTLLGDLDREGMDEFLISQHAAATQHAPAHLAIPHLDTLLQLYLQTSSEQPRKQRTPPVIEIAGAGPCSGKTQLLYRVAASLLIGASSSDTEPHLQTQDSHHESTNNNDDDPTHAAHNLSRPGGLVIWLDCAGEFDIQRLDGLISHLSGGDLSSRTATLTHFHLHRPASFSALLDVLAAISGELLGRSARNGSSPSAHRHVATLILSSASSFLPFERAAAAAHGSTEARQQPPHQTLNARYTKLIDLLRTLQQRLGCPIIATRRAGSSGPGLPPAWVKAVDIRLRVSRADWREKVPRGISVLEALEWREGRKNARIRAEEEQRDKEREEREMRLYLEGKGLDEEEVQKEFAQDAERTDGANTGHGSVDVVARFEGTVAGKGREASSFAMRVDRCRVEIEAS